MLEIFAVIYFTRKIGLIAEQKGLETRRWKRYTIFLWIAAEVLGIKIGMLLGQTSIISLSFMGIGFALAAYFTLQDFLLKKDDKKQKRFDINQHVED